jgi:hypothetical protein
MEYYCIQALSGKAELLRLGDVKITDCRFLINANEVETIHSRFSGIGVVPV